MRGAYKINQPYLFTEFKIVEGTYYDGGVLSHKTEDNFNDCLYKCLTNASCDYFNFGIHSKICNLKRGGLGLKHSSANIKTGIKLEYLKSLENK